MGLFSKLISAAIALAFTSACKGPDYPTPNQEEGWAASVFKVDVGDGTGTGWIVKNEDVGSYVMTAGHVCEGSDRFTLIARDGTEYHAYKIMESETPDMCELYSPATLGAPLALSDSPPTFNEPMVAIGAASGVWGDGVAPIFHVYSIGMDAYSGPIWPGMSGGPVVSKHGVVGMVTKGIFKAQIGFFEPVAKIKLWLEVKDVSSELGSTL